MKKVLIISPYFPPSNAPDMQRIRMSLPYFKLFGWEAEVVAVDPKYSEIVKDSLLTLSVPPDIPVHLVKAFSKNWTWKVGLGSISLRSLWFYKQKVNSLLKNQKFDLIYFSTTQFPVCILGSYWKKRFGVPYVIDMQDPWHSEYYINKPKSERPPKYWFSYWLNKLLEPIAMKNVSGLISVSKAYVSDLKNRYPLIVDIPAEIITFSAFEKDLEIVCKNKVNLNHAFTIDNDLINLIYVGRGGNDLHKAVRILLGGFKKGIEENKKVFEKIRFHFIGTSYAPIGEGKPTILPIASSLGLSDYVLEQTDRIPFYEALKILQEADILIIPGSDDPKYTASKIFPYVLARKPLLGVFSRLSSVFSIISDCNAGTMIDINSTESSTYVYEFLNEFLNGQHKSINTNWETFEEFTALSMTRKQCNLFEKIT